MKKFEKNGFISCGSFDGCIMIIWLVFIFWTALLFLYLVYIRPLQAVLTLNASARITAARVINKYKKQEAPFADIGIRLIRLKNSVARSIPLYNQIYRETFWKSLSKRRELLKLTINILQNIQEIHQIEQAPF